MVSMVGLVLTWLVWPDVPVGAQRSTNTPPAPAPSPLPTPTLNINAIFNSNGTLKSGWHKIPGGYGSNTPSVTAPPIPVPGGKLVGAQMDPVSGVIFPGG